MIRTKLPLLLCLLTLLFPLPARANEGYWVLDKASPTGGGGSKAFQFKVTKTSATVVSTGSADGTTFIWPELPDKIKFGDEAMGIGIRNPSAMPLEPLANRLGILEEITLVPCGAVGIGKRLVRCDWHNLVLSHMSAEERRHAGLYFQYRVHLREMAFDVLDAQKIGVASPMRHRVDGWVAN